MYLLLYNLLHWKNYIIIKNIAINTIEKNMFHKLSFYTCGKLRFIETKKISFSAEMFFMTIYKIFFN